MPSYFFNYFEKDAEDVIEIPNAVLLQLTNWFIFGRAPPCSVVKMSDLMTDVICFRSVSH